MKVRAASRAGSTVAADDNEPSTSGRSGGGAQQFESITYDVSVAHAAGQSAFENMLESSPAAQLRARLREESGRAPLRLSSEAMSPQAQAFFNGSAMRNTGGAGVRRYGRSIPAPLLELLLAGPVAAAVKAEPSLPRSAAPESLAADRREAPKAETSDPGQTQASREASDKAAPAAPAAWGPCIWRRRKVMLMRSNCC